MQHVKRHNFFAQRSLFTSPTTKEKMPTYSEEEKGEAIRIIGGKYEGREGWRKAGRTDTKKKSRVIIELDDGNQIERSITKDYVVPLTVPTNAVEQLLLDHIGLEKAMRKLCKELAKCRLTGEEQEVAAAFLERMEYATRRQQDDVDAYWYV